MPDKLHIIGGAAELRGQKINDDSPDELRFFEKPVEEFVDKKEVAGLKNAKQ